MLPIYVPTTPKKTNDVSALSLSGIKKASPSMYYSLGSPVPTRHSSSRSYGKIDSQCSHSAQRAGREPLNRSVATATKLIEIAQKEVHAAKVNNAETTGTIAELNDMLKQSLTRQNILESRLEEMHGQLLATLQEKAGIQQVRSYAIHDCRIAEAHSIDSMKKKERAEKCVDEIKAGKMLVELQLLKANKMLEKEKKSREKLSDECRELLIKNDALIRWGEKLESEARHLRYERDCAIKISTQAEAREIEHALKIEELNAQISGFVKEPGNGSKNGREEKGQIGAPADRQGEVGDHEQEQDSEHEHDNNCDDNKNASNSIAYGHPNGSSSSSCSSSKKKKKKKKKKKNT